MNKLILVIGIFLFLVFLVFGFQTYKSKNNSAKAEEVKSISANKSKVNSESNISKNTESAINTATETENKVDTSSYAINNTSSDVKEITVEGSNYSFSPSEIRVKKGEKVKITFVNKDGFHDLVIDEFNVRTPQVKAGATEIIEFTADKTGTFEYYCSVGKHREMGMKGSLIVE